MPTDSAYSRFLKRMMEQYSDLVNEIFNELVEIAMELLPNFGSTLAMDGKALQSFANWQNGKESARVVRRGRRRCPGLAIVCT